MRRIRNILLLGCAWLAFALGVIGVFVPVAPTTPLLLLATYLFAKSSPRCHAWIKTTKVYRVYVVAFNEAGGMSLSAKLRMLAVSFTVMGISAFLVQKPIVWLILSAVAVFLLYLAVIRIPTISSEQWKAGVQAFEVE